MKETKKYLVWKDYGYDGWGYEGFYTLEEATQYLLKDNQSREYIITKRVEIEIKEVEEIKPNENN